MAKPRFGLVPAASRQRLRLESLDLKPDLFSPFLELVVGNVVGFERSVKSGELVDQLRFTSRHRFVDFLGLLVLAGSTPLNLGQRLGALLLLPLTLA